MEISLEEEEAIEYIKAFQKDLYGASEKNLMAIYIDRVWDYMERLQKENQELKEDNSHQWEERCRLTFELEELKEELDYYKQKENQEFDERDYYEE